MEMERQRASGSRDDGSIEPKKQPAKGCNERYGEQGSIQPA
jgi:hypothetical protein